MPPPRGTGRPRLKHPVPKPPPAPPTASQFPPSKTLDGDWDPSPAPPVRAPAPSAAAPGREAKAQGPSQPWGGDLFCPPHGMCLPPGTRFPPPKVPGVFAHLLGLPPSSTTEPNETSPGWGGIFGEKINGFGPATEPPHLLFPLGGPLTKHQSTLMGCPISSCPFSPSMAACASL